MYSYVTGRNSRINANGFSKLNQAIQIAKMRRIGPGHHHEQARHARRRALQARKA